MVPERQPLSSRLYPERQDVARVMESNGLETKRHLIKVSSLLFLNSLTSGVL